MSIFYIYAALKDNQKGYFIKNNNIKIQIKKLEHFLYEKRNQRIN